MTDCKAAGQTGMSLADTLSLGEKRSGTLGCRVRSPSAGVPLRSLTDIPVRPAHPGRSSLCAEEKNLTGQDLQSEGGPGSFGFDEKLCFIPRKIAPAMDTGRRRASERKENQHV